MTRADINYIYQETGSMPKVLYHYENGDQYPRGLRDIYHVLDFVLGDWTPENFKKWIGNNYTETRRVTATGKTVSIEFSEHTEVPAEPELKEHKIIDDYTDYGYVFDGTLNRRKITVYSFGDKEFEGTIDEFVKWIKEQQI